MDTQFKIGNHLLDLLTSSRLRSAISGWPQVPHRYIGGWAQDLTRLQLTLVRRWSESAHYLVLAGDDDQTIYSWAGASPEAILEPDIPADHKFFLTQSSRVPRAIHAAAEKLIHQ